MSLELLSEYGRQLAYLSVSTRWYPLCLPGAKTWFVSASGYTPCAAGLWDTGYRFSATGANHNVDTNDGELPQRALATIGQAHTNAVAGRGDTICLMPGTYTLTAILTLSKAALRLVSLVPFGATITGDGVIATLVRLDGNDIELAGVRFAQAAAATLLVDLGNGAPINRAMIHHCAFIGGAVAGATALQNGRNQAGNNAEQTLVEDCLFSDFSAQAILTYGGNCRIRQNEIHMRAGGRGVRLGDQGAAFTRNPCFILRNLFSGAADAGADVPIDFEGLEANTQMWLADGNAFANCAAPESNIHPEGGCLNYRGTLTATAPALEAW